MKVIIVDNVNNVSGAPTVAREIAAALGCDILCFRTGTETSYRAARSGVRSDNAWMYLTGIPALLFHPSVLRRIAASDVVICNTALSFPALVLARLLRKQVICVLHEAKAKNALYRLGLLISIKFAHRIVTPSAKAYRHLQLDQGKWSIIPNCLAASYFHLRPAVASEAEPIDILFAGDQRAYKGMGLFNEIRRLANQDAQSPFRFHAVSDPAYRAQYGGSVLTADIYCRFHALLVLTDNALWAETFGLVGCEAAASRSLPISTDRFAYEEIWGAVDANLILEDRSASLILKRLKAIFADKEKVEHLRAAVAHRARSLCDPLAFAQRWRSLVSVI